MGSCHILKLQLQWAKTSPAQKWYESQQCNYDAISGAQIAQSVSAIVHILLSVDYWRVIFYKR